MFYTAYVDGYLEQTEVYQIDINTGEILWKAKGGKNELLLTADTTKEGESLYMYKEGTIYRLTGEDFKQEENLGEIHIKDSEGKETLIFNLNEETIRISYDDTPEDLEFEFERNK